MRRQVRTLTEAAKDRPGYICADISQGVEAVGPASPMIVHIRHFFSSVPTDWGQQHTALQKRQLPLLRNLAQQASCAEQVPIPVFNRRTDDAVPPLEYIR